MKTLGSSPRDTLGSATDITEQSSHQPWVSVVIPCLNECATIAEAVSQAKAAFAGWLGGAEVIVADNGSTDGSAELAEAVGARVIAVPERGYGAALRAGFSAARTPYIVYADADLTYDFHEGTKLVAALHEQDADMVVGTRIQGQIEPGAMPTLHRHLGTPVLTGMINLIFGGCLTDCNSGFRAFRRDRLPVWQPCSSGMEFASELLINALRAGAKIVEVPITLRSDRSNREPHLQTWRDGMRHFLTILARAPWLFVKGGLAAIGLSLFLVILCALGPRLLLGRFAVFDYHTLIFATILGFLGAQLVGTGLVLHLQQPPPYGRLATKLIHLHEGVLFWMLTGIGLAIFSGVGFIVWSWARHGFANIAYLKLTLLLLYAVTVTGSLAISVFHAHLMKRA
jgi:glycosyltransferase involved in cell wall biosynthesis